MLEILRNRMDVPLYNLGRKIVLSVDVLGMDLSQF